nr:DUF3365 domain-containing protein [Desulfobacula sp.]
MAITIFNNKFKGGKKQVIIPLFGMTIAMMASAALFSWMSYAYVLEKAEENITNLLLSHKGIHHYVQNTLIPAYSKYQEDGKIPTTFYAPELLSSSFIVRNQHEFYNQERKISGFPELYYKLAANNPRNPVNKADALEKNLIRMFNENLDIKSYKEIVEVAGKKVLYVAIPFLANDTRCMRCHSKRDIAPPELQQRYPGQGGFNEKIGEIRAITSIRAPMEHEYNHIYIIGLTIFIGFIAFAGLFFFNTRLRTLVLKRTTSLEEEIAERKHTEQSLIKSEKQFRNLFNSITDLIYTQDMEGRFTSTNPAMQRLFGYDMDEFIGHRAVEFMKPEFQSGFDSQYLEVIKENGYHEGISCYFKKNREKIYIEYRSSFVKPDDGSEPYISGIGRDVTEKILSEKKVAQLQKQIAQSQKMESIGTLAGGIAHDFNNILFPIVGYTEMLLEDVPEDNPSRGSLKQIYTSALRARSLVKQILTFSRQESSELMLMKMQPIVKEALKLIRSTIPTTIEIKQDINPDCGVIKADPTQIHQIVMNL